MSNLSSLDPPEDLSQFVQMSFDFIRPEKQVPILISSPHSGTAFPKSLESVIDQKFVDFPQDTDWFIDRLYDFAPEMGITLVSAKYSRYVIDLNRRRDSQALYNDSRQITKLVPTHTFAGEPLYHGIELNEVDISERIRNFYDPYYAFIEAELKDLKENFEQVLFFDAHSIKKNVPSIQEAAFADLTLGNNDGQSATEELIQCACDVLSSTTYEFSHNEPFKGGNLTRHFGNPQNGISALQLEMSQQCYMNESDTVYVEQNAESMRNLLKSMFDRLISVLQSSR